MTTLYRPVLIETAEQAEALPINTLAISADGVDPAIRKEDGWHGIFGDPPYSHAEMVSDYALMPIEAKDETTHEMRTCRGIENFAPSHGIFPVPSHRLVTPWEAVS